MDTIIKFIQQNPGLVAWTIVIVNVAWILFVYFNTQKHDRKLKHLEQELRFSADRRLKVFDLKATQYSQYVTNLDSFGRKYQLEIPNKFQPIFNKYLKDYLAATSSDDSERQHEVITWFASEISVLIQESNQDLQKLKFESNRLKLIATDEMLETFDKIETLTIELTNASNEFMQDFVKIITDKNEERTKAFQEKAAMLSNEIQIHSKKLLGQMRHEIVNI